MDGLLRLPSHAVVTSYPVLLKFLASHSCWRISSSTTSIFIFLPIEKFVDLPAHLLREDHQRTLPALVEDALAVALEEFVERGGSKFSLWEIGLWDVDFGSVSDDLAPDRYSLDSF